MADNDIVLNEGTGGATVASDDIGGVHYPRSKISLGADGTAVDAIPVSNGLDTTATGVQAVGLVAQFDDTSTGTVTENQFAPVRISSRRALLVEGVASGTAIPVSNAGLTELAAAIDTEVQVDVVGALPTGDNNIGNVDIASIAAGDNNIGNVDVASIVPGTGATNLGKAEDAAHSSGDVGVMALVVRQDTHSDLGADGDYVPMTVNANGGLRVAVIDSTGAQATLANVSTLSNANVLHVALADGNGDDVVVARAEDAAHSSGDHGIMALAVRDDAPAAVSGTDGDYEPLHVSAEGGLWVTPTPSTAGGLSTFMASGSDGSSILVATAQAIKASAGAMYGYYAYNPEAAVTFVHFYNTAAASVTVGTTNPMMTFAIPAGAAANLSFPHGVAFSNTGWSCAATTTAGGNTAPGTGVSLVVWYK